MYPEMILAHINTFINRVDLPDLQAKTRAAQGAGEIAYRLGEPITTLFDQMYYLNDIDRSSDFQPSEIDKEYLVLLAWILFSYSKIWDWDAFVCEVEQRIENLKLEDMTRLMNMAAEELESHHKYIQSLIQLLNEHEVCERYGGPWMSCQKPNILATRMDRDKWISNFTEENQKAMEQSPADFRGRLNDVLEKIHTCMDKRNSITYGTMIPSTQGFRQSFDDFMQRSTHTPKVSTKEALRKLTAGFDLMGDLTEASTLR